MDKPGNVDSGKMTEPLYVCVHVPRFPAQALMRLRPELHRSSVVVLAGDPPLEQVCSFNINASKAGIRMGMTRAELDLFTGLCVLIRSELEEGIAHSLLLEVAGSFTPRIEVHHSGISDFVMVLDMSGCTRLHGSPSQVVNKILAAFNTVRFMVQLAACINFHASICIAAVATKAPVLLAAGEERGYLQNLPLDTLPLTDKQAEKLSLWGLQTLGDLASLPEVELVVRLGQQGRRLQMLARGEYPHLMVPHEPVFTLDEFLAFDTPVDLLDSLLFLLGPMLDQLIARAQNRSYALASVCVIFSMEGGGTHERTIKPAIPVASREILLKLLHLDLLAHPPTAAVTSLFLHAEPGDLSKVQLGLFSPQLPEPMRLNVTLARISALVGEDRVGRVRLLDTHRPDSFAVDIFTVPEDMTQAISSSHPVAIRRCRPPGELFVEWHESQLRSIWHRGKRYQVQKALGPWRKSGEWWSTEVWSHEEWDVCAQSEAGEILLCVIANHLLQKRWQLEALYD